MQKRDEIKSIWESQLQTVFESQKHTEMDILLSILSIIMYDKFDDKIGKLYTTVNDIELFTKIINIFSGMTITVPNRDEFKDAISLALTYHYKNIKNMSWAEIKKELPYDSSLPLKTGKNIVKLNNTIKEKLEDILREEV